MTEGGEMNLASAISSRPLTSNLCQKPLLTDFSGNYQNIKFDSDLIRSDFSSDHKNRDFKDY